MARAMPVRNISWRYAILGLCLAVLAALRSNEGDEIWALVFGLAALGNVYLALRPALPPRLGGEAQPRLWPTDYGRAGSEPSPEELRRALETYEPRMKHWLVIAVGAWASTVVITLLAPPLGLAGAALSLFAAHRYLRCHRSVRALRRMLRTV